MKKIAGLMMGAALLSLSACIEQPSRVNKPAAESPKPEVSALSKLKDSKFVVADKVARQDMALKLVNSLSDPNPKIREWYARDVFSLAESMKTEPLMIVQTEPGDGPSAKWPRIGKERATMRNQHLSYAITWFSLAAVWAVMSLLWFRKLARD